MKLKTGGIILIIALLAVSAAYFALRPEPDEIKMDDDTEVHIHPIVNIRVCEKTVMLPKNTGVATLHTHDDVPRLHIEAPNIKLGDFFKIINTRFNATCFGEYCTGDYCPLSSLPGELKVYVNGTQNFELAQYQPKDWDDILIEFK